MKMNILGTKIRKIIILLFIVIFCLTLFTGCSLFDDEDENKEKTTGERQPKVYITYTGECYHSENCQYLYSKIPIGLYEAKRRGYRACKVCHGISSGYIYV